MMMMMNCYGFVVQLLVGMSKCRGFLYICCRRFSKVILLYICCVFHLVDNHCLASVRCPTNSQQFEVMEFGPDQSISGAVPHTAYRLSTGQTPPIVLYTKVDAQYDCTWRRSSVKLMVGNRYTLPVFTDRIHGPCFPVLGIYYPYSRPARREHGCPKMTPAFTARDCGQCVPTGRPIQLTILATVDVPWRKYSRVWNKQSSRQSTSL